MIKARARITVVYEVDLNPVPGWGHSPEDWVQAAQSEVMNNIMMQDHYNPVVIEAHGDLVVEDYIS